MARETWRLSGYRVEELIGAGASGDVWRARVASNGAAVALKRIWVARPEQRETALSEAAMLSSLDHPHVMKLHDVRRVDDDAIALVLDLAGGGSLATLLARRGRLTVGETITAVAPVAAALAYAHHNGVVHGDVSAANILFTDIGLPLLADLGVARLLGEAAPVNTTPAYIDPNVAAGGLPTASSDVFMVAAVALHALTGAPPWPGHDPQQVLEEALTGDQPDFAGRMARAGVPAEVARVVARALSIDPDDRGSAADLALELRHAGDPVAVELAAGRVGAALHAGDADSWPLQSVPAGAGPGAGAGAGSVPMAVRVPPFARAPLTHGVRAPAPFTGPPPAGRHAADGGVRPRIAAGLVACIVAVVLAAVAAAVWWPGGDEQQAAARAGATTESRAGTRASAATPSPTPTAVHSTRTSIRQPGRAAAGIPARTMRAALATLDAARSQAFARRDPAGLAQVYASSQLLARDRALLTSIVPPGCGLQGVRTHFGAVRVVSRAGPRTTLRALLSVPRSTLVCGATRSGPAAGVPPTWMTITLLRTSSAQRIAGEHPLEDRS